MCCVLCAFIRLICFARENGQSHHTQHNPTDQQKIENRSEDRKKLKIKTQKPEKVTFCQTYGWLMNDVHGIFMILWAGFLCWRVCFCFFSFSEASDFLCDLIFLFFVFCGDVQNFCGIFQVGLKQFGMPEVFLKKKIKKLREVKHKMEYLIVKDSRVC